MKYTVIFLFVCLGIGPVAAQRKAGHAVSKKVDQFMAEKMKSLQIPGASLAVLRDGKIIHTQGYGMANLEHQVPAQPATNYLIASVTKSFTAVAAMMLWEGGWFQLDDPIGKYLDSLPEHWNPLTIRQLMNHTSGIPYNLELPPPCDFEFDPDHYTRQNYLQEVACLPLNFPPGTKWAYSGTTGYTLLGMLIEKLSGQSYGEFLQQRIFQPLEMRETGMMDNDHLIPNRADGYALDDTDGVVHSDVLDPVGEFSSSGLRSTVLDLAKWDAALSDGKLLLAPTWELMFTNAQLSDGTVVPSYGLGFGLTPYQGHRRVGHTGGTPGFSASYNRFIDDGITVILLANINHEDFNVLQLSNEIAAFYFK
ncbi:MAG: beta-lactamase family protein [Lewinellaceae bacterium]|nr:beta-lactamase family protein [Lewinellaceae bacterium]